MLFEMNRGIEEDLGCPVLKENLDFLLEDQRYGLFMPPFCMWEGRLTVGTVTRWESTCLA